MTFSSTRLFATQVQMKQAGKGMEEYAIPEVQLTEEHVDDILFEISTRCDTVPKLISLYTRE